MRRVRREAKFFESLLPPPTHTSGQLMTVRCRTSLPAVSLKLSRTRIVVIQDLRYIEYATALGTVLMNASNVGALLEDGGRLMLSFAHEITLNYDHQYAKDLLYANYGFGEKSVYGAIRPGAANRERFPGADFARPVFQVGIMAHEMHHVHIRLGMLEHIKTAEARAAEIVEYCRKSVAAGRSDELLGLDQAVLHFISTLDGSSDRLTAEELMCDMPLLLEVFADCLGHIEGQDAKLASGLVPLMARIQMALPVAIQLLECTRMRALSREEGVDDVTRVLQERMFRSREAFQFIGLLRLIELYEQSEGLDNARSLSLIEAMRSFGERSALLFKQMDLLTRPQAFRSLHSMAAGMARASGLRTGECMQLARAQWRSLDVDDVTSHVAR